MSPTCRGCGAIIRWLHTKANGKAMPVDPERLHEWLTDEPRGAAPKITLVTPDGEVVTGYQGSIITPGARSIEGDLSHFASCPKANQFRRGANA